MSSPADVKAKLPKRVADYFVVVGFGAAGGGGEDHRIRGRTVKGLGAPQILDRFPREDWKDAEFPKKCAMFCFPTPIMSFATEKAEPDMFSFAMTDSDGTRLFGSVYTIWEEVSAKMWAPRALCLISHWPFCYQFQRFLSQIHRGMTPGLKFPLERLVLNFICEVPLPPEGKVIVRYNSLPHPLQFCRPPPNKPPLRDFELTTLFECLSVDNVLSLFSAVMVERSILFTSNKFQTLMNACQVITYLLCPFFWRHIYIPVLPQAMADVVCAPMPFMVGMLEKDRPDPHMLNGVVIIDLDKNAIMTLGDTATIPPLPQGRFQALMKRLRKLTGDTTLPLRGAHNVESSAIETLFLKFHAKLFKNYRDFLEAPSDYVIDRFDKNKFVAQHPERGPFLTEFMMTQMLQCFVDERYELTAAQSRVKARNLEILFFDEFIDKVHKKNSPFLGDTSLAHASEPYDVLLPSDAGKMPTASSTNLYQYTNFPKRLDDSLFGQPRVVAPLVTDDDLSSGRGDMSKLSMKFFTEKRMYSQHFHALRVRSNKQDVAFNEIVRYFKSAQTLDEQQIAGFGQMCQATISKDTLETGSSIDSPWSSLKGFVNNQNDKEVEAFKILREEVCTPLYSSCAEANHMLAIRFSEAGKLESKASRGKTDVERAKAVRDVLLRKWLDLKSQNKESLLSPSDIARMVATHNDAEAAILNLDLVEVDFQNIVNEYEARMPDIITTIRGLNGKRINEFKKALTAWCIAQRVQLHSSLSHLDELEKEVQQIDAVKDLKSFMTGTTDFWAKSGRRPSQILMEVLGETPTGPPPPPPAEGKSEQKTDQPQVAHLRRFTLGSKPEKESLDGLPKCYPINLWGPEGYSMGEERARFTIDTVDEMASLLEEWGKVQDVIATKFTTLVRGSPNLVEKDSKTRVWVALKSRIDTRAKNHAVFSKLLLKMASELQLTKSQMRSMIKRFSEHRARLDRDLAEKNDEKLKAQQKQQLAKRAADMATEQGSKADNQLTVMELEKRTQRIEQVNKSLNEAEAALAMAERAREAVKIRQDVCLGRVLNSFEEKEKETGAQLQSALMFVMEQCTKAFVTSLIDGDENVEAKIKQVDYTGDLRELILACYDKNVPQHERLKDTEAIDLGSNLGWSRFHVAVDVFNRTGTMTKILSSFIGDVAGYTETYCKSLRKLPFEMKTCTAPSLGRAFQELHKVSKELCDNLEQEVKNLRDVVKVLVKHQDTLRTNLKAHQKAYTDMDIAYNKAVRDQAKTEKDVMDAEANMKLAEAKLAKARERKETVNDLLIKAGYAKQNYENLKEVQLKKADEHLVHASKFRGLAVSALLRQMQEEDESRNKVQVGTLTNMVDFHKRRVYKFDKTLDALFHKISGVDVDGDIVEFLARKADAAAPPDVVIADVRFRIANAPPKAATTFIKPPALGRRDSGSLSTPKGTPVPDGSRVGSTDGKESDEDEHSQSRGIVRERSAGVVDPVLDGAEGEIETPL